MRFPWASCLPFALSCTLSCSDALPDDIADYAECPTLNADPLPKRQDDPHEGRKNVYACGLDCGALADRPFPDGTIIVKESIKDGQGYAWLVATARKIDGHWSWNEYTRNFEHERFVSILAGEQVCIDCHKKWEADDWIATALDEEAACP
jgi:hypothetical protein